MRTNHHHHHHQPGLWPGLILVSVGGGLLAREFGLLPPQVRVVDFWPLILVCAGISGLLRARGFMGALFALAFAAVGALLLASNLGFLVFPAARLWPGLLVLLGVAFLIRAVRGTRGQGPHTDPPAAAGLDADDDSYEEPRHGAPTTVDDRLDKQILFSGLEFKVESQAWKGGELGVTAGGVEIDLRQARLDPGGALLDVRILMGGVDIRVPDTWQVKNDVIPLLGGADDSTRTTQGSTDAPLLRVVGSVTLGGISIHN
ncbi:MAG: DUF5668 domain-containing protein [Myxococcales bacterium]|jgi:hypothetical protein